MEQKVNITNRVRESKNFGNLPIGSWFRSSSDHRLYLKVEDGEAFSLQENTLINVEDNTWVHIPATVEITTQE